MADKRSGPPSRGGNSRGGPPSRGGRPSSSRDSGRGPSSDRSGGGFGGGSRDGGSERSSRPFGDRPPRRDGDRPFNDRPPRRDGAGFGGPPRGDRPFGDRPPRGDRPFGDRPPRRDGDRPFNDRPKRDFGDRPSFDRGPPRGDRPFNDRPKRDYNDRPPRDDNREDRAPRRDSDMPFEDRPRRNFQKDGFGASRKRDDMDTTRPRSDGPRTERREYSSDRPPRDDRAPRGDRPSYDRGPPRGDRPQRSYDDRPPRREGFEKRPTERNETDNVDEAPRGMKGHETLIYGVHAVKAALNNPNRKVTTIWVSDIGEAHLEGAYDDKRHPEFITVTKREIENKLPAGAVHQGIAIAVEPLDDVYLTDILTAANAPNAERSVVVVLDEVTDPHNVGAVLRSMSMFGAKAMIVHKRNAPSITGVMAKIATGAIEHVPMVAVTNLSQALEEMKLAGFYCLGLDENATIALGDVPDDRPIALVLGNEGEGLRAKTRTTCDAIAAIPSFGAIKSLNVSNAAAIALYSITKK